MANEENGNAYLESQLQNLIGLRSSDHQIAWTIFSIFCATTAVLLVALFPKGQLPSSNFVGLVISIVGCFLSCVWWLIQWRVMAGIEFHEEIIRNLENKLPIPDDYATSRETTEAYKKHLGKCTLPRVRPLMIWVPLTIKFLWGFASLFFLINLIYHGT